MKLKIDGLFSIIFNAASKVFDLEHTMFKFSEDFDLLKAKLIEANFFLVRKIINKFSPWLHRLVLLTYKSIKITAKHFFKKKSEMDQNLI